MQEAPVASPSRPDTPAPMETGGAGDGQTWAEQVETSVEAEFQWVRPPFPIKETGDRAKTSLSPSGRGGEARLCRETLRIRRGAAVPSG